MKTPQLARFSAKWLATEQMKLAPFKSNPQGCWLWLRAVDRKGYGFISVADPKTGQERVYAVHRLSYEFHRGKLGPGIRVRHTCHVRRCFNPKHLIPGTAKENTQDMIRAGRASWQKDKLR